MGARAESIARLRDASKALRSMQDAEVVDSLSRVLKLWDGDDGLVARAARELAAHRKQSEDMLRFGLHRMIQAHSRTALLFWLSEARVEAGRRLAIHNAKKPLPDLGSLRGPAVVAQVLAGNVPALAIPAALEALLARSAVVLKPADEDLISAQLFKESLDQAAPELSGCVDVERWSGGNDIAEAEVFGAVDYVIASGGQQMVQSLTKRLSSKPHTFYGPRISIGLVGMGWLDAPGSWWDDVAREIAIWDQRGCLSPRILFVAGDPERFARRLAPALNKWQEKWPAGPPSLGEGTDIISFRTLYQMAKEGKAGIFASNGTAWTVVWDHSTSLEVGPPARAVRITIRPSSRDLEAMLIKSKGLVQGAGLDFLVRGDLEWRRALEHGGVGFVAPLTSLQDPPAGWRADGRSGLAELLARGTPVR
jgi:acyl-CoA reductase LuxC